MQFCTFVLSVQKISTVLLSLCTTLLYDIGMYNVLLFIADVLIPLDKS